MPGQFTIASAPSQYVPARFGDRRESNPGGTVPAKPFSLTAGTSIASGLEVAYEHYRGSYSRRVMYTPVIMSAVLAVAGIAGFFSGRAARTVLRLVSAVTLGDAAIGFYFHVRGIQRKPGGWRLPMTNMIMGPPIFAPLLFGTSAYLGLIASFLRRQKASCDTRSRRRTLARQAFAREGRSELLSAEQDIREGRFQRQVAIVTGSQRVAQRLRSFLLALQKQFSLRRAVDSHHSRTSSCSRVLRLRKEPSDRHDGASGTVFAGLRRRSHRILLSRTRRASPAGWQRASSLQHHVWPADLCPIAIWRGGNAWIAGQPAAEEARMKPESETTITGVDSSLFLAMLQRRTARTRNAPGYYPGFSTLSPEVLSGMMRRASSLPSASNATIPRQFFSRKNGNSGRRFSLISFRKTDRTPDRQIPIVAAARPSSVTQPHRGISLRQHAAGSREAYRLGREAMNQEAQTSVWRRVSLACRIAQQDLVLKAIHDGEPKAAPRYGSDVGTSLLAVDHGGMQSTHITPTRGHGMRSASAVPLILALTRAWSAASRSHGRWKRSATSGWLPRLQCRMRLSRRDHTEADQHRSRPAQA